MMAARTHPFHLPSNSVRGRFEHGIRFIYQRPDAPANPVPKPTAAVLRVLAIYSVPTDKNPPTPRKQLRSPHRLFSQPFRRKRL
jgi:hypothetical protein